MAGFFNVSKLDLFVLFPSYFLTLLVNTQSIALVGFVVCRKHSSKPLRPAPFQNPLWCFSHYSAILQELGKISVYVKIQQDFI